MRINAVILQHPQSLLSSVVPIKPFVKRTSDTRQVQEQFVESVRVAL